MFKKVPPLHYGAAPGACLPIIAKIPTTSTGIFCHLLLLTDNVTAVPGAREEICA
jgi:hypothetical protein